MAGKSGRAIAFTRKTLSSEIWTRPAPGKSDELISDLKVTQLKLRVRQDMKPVWYVHFSHPLTRRRIREQLGEMNPRTHPDEIRDLALKVIKEATIARKLKKEGAAFDNRNMSVADIVTAYIDRLEAGEVDRKNPTSPKTLTSYRKDRDHIERLYVGIKASDLTEDIIKEKNAENVRRIRLEHDQEIERCRQNMSLNLTEIRDPEEYGLTPRNIRKRLNENGKLEDKIEKLQDPKRTGHQHNRNATVLIKAAFKECAGKTGFPPIQKHFDIKLKGYTSQIRSLTEDEADALTQYCTDMVQNKTDYPTWRHACFIMLLMLSGARKTEMMTAEIASIKKEKGRYSIACLNNKEGDRTKRVQFLKGADVFIKALVGNRGHGQLFDVTEYPDVAARNIVKAAGINKWTGFHDLRHTFASKAIAAGISLPQIAQMLGQTTMSVTQTYGYLFDEEKSAAYELMDAREQGRKPSPAAR